MYYLQLLFSGALHHATKALPAGLFGPQRPEKGRARATKSCLVFQGQYFEGRHKGKGGIHEKVLAKKSRKAANKEKRYSTNDSMELERPFLYDCLAIYRTRANKVGS